MQRSRYTDIRLPEHLHGQQHLHTQVKTKSTPTGVMTIQKNTEPLTVTVLIPSTTLLEIQAAAKTSQAAAAAVVAKAVSAGMPSVQCSNLQ